MPLILETIKIENAEVFNLDYHQKRFDQTRRDLFHTNNRIDLSSLINIPSNGLYRCRVVYDSHIQSITYIPYQPKSIQKLKVISSDISYAYKYADREFFNTLLKHYQYYDEIIIEKAGYITDCTIANLAFYNGERWLTPETPLLKGTMREKLLDENFLLPAAIKKEDLPHYSHVALMNAMIGFKVLNNPTLSI